MAGDSAVRIQVLELDRRSVYGSSDGPGCAGVGRVLTRLACAPSGSSTPAHGLVLSHPKPFAEPLLTFLPRRLTGEGAIGGRKIRNGSERRTF